MFKLDYNGGDVQCPHCKKSFGIEWDTEYGDPLMNDQTTECLECKKTFTFQALLTYSSWA